MATQASPGSNHPTSCQGLGSSGLLPFGRKGPEKVCQTLQLKGPPQSAWQGKGPSARVSCPEGSRGPGRAESRRLLALVLAKERARGRLWAQACAPSLQGPRRRGRRVCAWPRGRQGRPGRNGQRPRRDLRPSRPGAVCLQVSGPSPASGGLDPGNHPLWGRVNYLHLQSCLNPFQQEPPISPAHPSHQELEFAPKVQSCSQDEGRGLDFRSPWHPGDLRGVPRPPQTFPSKTKDVTSNPRCGGHKISQAPEQSRIL